jgi:D-alanyl-lipoteichoic acid acyltransferase DltB (MBOAT superfamily)
MLFNSTLFLAFFSAVYALHLLLQRHTRLQNVWLLLASYLFYAAWDWRFLGLIALSTAVDYLAGLRMSATADAAARRRWVVTSVGVNLGILATCKYLDFFAESLAGLAGLAGLELGTVTLHFVLPVGISFYTFQSMSYSIDVYRRRTEACTSALDFALFVAFFPQLVAGPIERASRLLPQIVGPRRIDADAVQTGIFLIVWGLFKKVVVADNAGRLADLIFGNHTSFGSLDLTIGVLAFSVQIYGDFSGYSDIARGLAKLLGFDLMVNFRLPWFARSPADFWRRWHISLSEWLRDYLYIPLGGSRWGSGRTLRNLALTMILGGLWHGAAWTFVLWGAYQGVLLVAQRLLEGGREPSRRGLAILGQTLLTFVLMQLGWLIFRAESLEQLAYFLQNLGFAPSSLSARFAWDLLFVSWPLLAVQLWQHHSGQLLAPLRTPLGVRVAVHSFLLAAIVVLGVREATEFLYFQF